jgi:subtilisin family serine protease
MNKKLHLLLLALLLTALLCAAPVSAVFAQSDSRIDGAVLTDLAASGQARVIVSLRDPVGRLPGLNPVSAGFAERVAALQDGVIASVDGSRRANPAVRVRHRYQFVPALSMTVDAAALSALLASPLVSYIENDEPTQGHLLQSVPALNADDVHALGYTGAGVRVAVLDSGIPASHPDINPAVFATVCFTGGNGGSLGNCAPSNTFTGTSAFDAPYPGQSFASGHGTNVTGVITSDGIVSPIGFAPGTQIAAVRVLDGRNAGWVSDWIAGLDWIIANQSTLQIRIINMSLGTSALYNGSCEAQQPSTHAAIQTLVNTLGIIVFASSGNQGSSTSISAPACLPNVVAVGATYDSDLGRQPPSGTYNTLFGGSFPACFDASSSLNTVTCFSNSSSMIDVLAPGRPIQSAGLNSNTSTFSGTSQASPTAAGIAALMLQFNPALTPAQIESILETTGIAVTDAKNGVTRPRVDALAAFNSAISANIIQNGSFSTAFTGGEAFRQWKIFGAPETADNQWRVQSGVFEFYRRAPLPGQSTSAAVLQNTGVYLAPGAPVEIAVLLGNSSLVRQRVSLLAHDANFSDLQICSFWLPANSPLRLYRMTFSTRAAWTNTSLSIYASTASSEGYIRVDDVLVNYKPASLFNGVMCHSPDAPPVTPSAPDGANLLSDPSFTSGVIGNGNGSWGIFSAPDDDAQNIDYRISGGVFEFYRKNRANLPPFTGNSAALLQYTQDTIPTSTIIEATFSLGNSTPNLGRITVLLHRRSFTDLAVCTFWLPAGTPLTTFTMRAYTSQVWEPAGDHNPMISFYSSSGHASGWLQVDNVSLRTRPAVATVGTECVSGGGGSGAGIPALPDLLPTAVSAPFAPPGAPAELPLVNMPESEAVESADSAEGSISE